MTRELARVARELARVARELALVEAVFGGLYLGRYDLGFDVLQHYSILQFQRRLGGVGKQMENLPLPPSASD